MIVILNAQAGGGRAALRWARLKPALAAKHPHRLVVTGAPSEIRGVLAEAAEAGERVVVAAGGDGCLNEVLNALMDPRTDAPRHAMALGAIGLGSSNDFHKPRDPARLLAGVPVATDLGAARIVDVGRVDWVGPDGSRGTRYFLLNASLGATAEGNWRYNHPQGPMALCKRLHPDVAIQYGTLEAIAKFAPVRLALELDGAPAGTLFTSNLGIIKRPYFCGGMHYDTPVTPDDGHFDVNYLGEMGRGEFVRAVLAIGQGRFLGLPKRHHLRARRVVVRPEAPAALELDGEVLRVVEAELRVIPRAITVCG